MHGWKKVYDFGETGAKFAIGGQRGKAYVSFPGDALRRIGNWCWPQLAEFLGEDLDGRITRWDGAADDYEGEYTVDWALDQYRGNGFQTRGNKPRMKQYGNWDSPDGTGRTLYIGSRKNGKLLRVYEKGKQLGDPRSPWVRWEAEYHNVDRWIPWDVLTNPAPYISGSFPCLAWVCGESRRIRTFKDASEISLDHVILSARTAYGPLVNHLADEGYTDSEIVKLIRRDGRPRRLNITRPPEASKVKVRSRFIEADPPDQLGRHENP